MSIQSPGISCAFILALVTFTGCTGSTESPQNSLAANAGASAPTSQAALTSDHSNSENKTPTASSEEALDGLPEDVFVAKSHVSSQLTETSRHRNVHLKYSAGDIENPVSTFHAGMKDNGWTLVTSSELPIGTIANFSKDDRRCTVSVAPPKDQLVQVAIVIPKQ